MKNKIYNSSLMKVMVCLFIVNTAAGQKAMNVMSSNIMKPYEEPTPKTKLVKFGIGAETYVSGNAHGAFYSASINVLKKNTIFSLGPCLQKRSLELNGVKFGCSVLLSGSKDRYDEDELKELAKIKEPELLELRMTFYTQYTHNARLSYNASRVETITNPESKVNFCQTRFSTVEIGICPELAITYKNIKLRTYAGCTTFYHIDHLENMYRPKFAPTLVFGAGIFIPKM